MSKKVLIETEDQRFLRDPSSMALINNDVAAYAQYKQKRQQHKQVDNLTKELDDLKNDMSEIKSMLTTLTGAANGK
jgi:hypothetical protein